MPSRILLFDNDQVLRTSLAEQLVQEGTHAVTTAATLPEALEAARATPFGLIIIGEPEGEAQAHALRAGGHTCPILLLRESGESENANGLAYLNKPFRLAALLARIRTLTRCHNAGSGVSMRIGPYTFHPAAKLLEAGARKVRLTEKEANILKFLHANTGTVPRQILLHEVWGYSPAVATHTLETHIYRLRKKIEEDPAHAQILLTEEGGYRLSA